MIYLVGTDIGTMGTKSVLVDVEGVPVGDAILAGLGTGVITDHRVIEDWLGEKVKTETNPKQSGLYDTYYDLH